MTLYTIFRLGQLHWIIQPFSLFSNLFNKINHKTSPSFQDDNHRLRILLVEDDVDDRELFEEAVLQVNNEIVVDTAANGDSLLKKLEVSPIPDVIFLDLNMPGRSGKDCLKEIRKHKDWKKIPVFIYSTSVNRKDVQDTYDSGANLYLVKPSNFKDLITLIGNSFSVDLDKPAGGLNAFVLKMS